MILTCPNCGTQYVVKDGAIPTEGRQVRCAACKHSWHQDPEDVATPEAAPRAAAAEAGPMAEGPSTDEAVGSAHEDESIAAHFGINGVPFFVLDRRLGVSGAQPVEVLLGALEEAAGETLRA